ncbi:hypothetical protein [Noviluteimonas gilva]|uniref:hypothetical protein n=1 Tax=Noviluteimonas gilva TaxID=2682097 RepID=UPI0018D229E9|nr:hypothetical protein [Lysobacter gilvus]
MPFRRTLVVALLCALPMLSAAAAEEAAKAPETIKWILPWKDGVSLTYAVESTSNDGTTDTPQSTRMTGTDVVRITESSPEGFLQTWTSSGGKFEIQASNQVAQAQMQAFADALKDLPVAAQLDAAGNFMKLRNMDVIVPRFQSALRPLFKNMLDAELAKITDEKARAKKQAEAMPLLDRITDTITSPAMIEGLIAGNISWYNGFVGIDVEPDAEYGLDVELPNAAGGPPIPARLTYSLSVSPDDPDDLYVVFLQAADSEKAQDALRESANRLVDGKISKEALAEVDVGIKDEGLFVVHRPTGVVEMFETTRTTTVHGKEKTQRTRMRLLDGDHDHVWKDEDTDAPQAASKDA